MLSYLFMFPAFANSNTVKIIRKSSEEDKVTLRVQVINDQRIPIRGLTAGNVKVETILPNEEKVILQESDIDLISPEKSKPDPTYLVILLDMSGSMKHEDDSGIIKLTGAIQGIRTFLEDIEAQNLPVQVALIPFGERGETCQQNYPVTQEIIRENLETSPYRITELYLSKLSKIDVCASTNLYQPLSEAVTFLGTEENLIENASEIVPRLGVILFTDGFDADPNRKREEKRFKKLKNTLAEYPQVTVHTMGYGEPLLQLYNRSLCEYELSDEQLTVNNLLAYCRLRKEDITEYIVDQNRLEEIAKTTSGGISLFPEDSEEVSESLKTFLTTLREYEITYQQPGAEKAQVYPTKVIVNSSKHGLDDVTSQLENVSLSNYLYAPLSVIERIGILILTIIMGVLGYKQFIKWSQNLKEKAKSNLHQG